MSVPQGERVQDGRGLQQVVPALHRETPRLGVDEVLAAGGVRGDQALPVMTCM
ncbi:hypothetical protein ABT391_26380 [Streptomyces jumonjinensis]|uniref:hypothetical protein n=1 Tax=Streptomyces jumonjinensis TaxID=1945 RepID=UPI0033312F9A